MPAIMKPEIRGIYEKVLEGKNITDKELAYALPYFRDLSIKLLQLGPVFTLAFQETNRIANMLEGWQTARARG